MTRLADYVPTALADAGDRALTDNARGMTGSLILGIAAEVRALQAQGAPVCNLTVGDFDARQFPVPRGLRDATVAAIDGYQTNYPPSEGIPELRKAIAAWYGKHLGIEVSPDWIVVAGGARPVMYGTYRLFLERGDTLVFAVPSWNNGYYGQLTEAKMVPVRTRAEDNFFPTAAALAPILREAQLLTLNSPNNPTGTVIDPDRLAEIARVVVAENERRVSEGHRPLMWMWDQVYWQLTYGTARHAHPAALVPEVAPWVVTIDAISKCWAATGLRVGWAVLPPRLAERMKTILQHVGAWAPRPEQAATAAFLADEDAMAAFSREFRGGLEERLRILDEGLTKLGVEHLVPQGAIYLSVRFDVFGRPGVDGQPMRTNDAVRKWLLQKAGLAVVPFQAFDVDGDEGWFRMSVGAVSPQQLRDALERLAVALAG